MTKNQRIDIRKGAYSQSLQLIFSDAALSL
jgi:hypothetical protein